MQLGPALPLPLSVVVEGELALWEERKRRSEGARRERGQGSEGARERGSEGERERGREGERGGATLAVR